MFSNPLSYIYLVYDREYIRSTSPFEVGDLLLDREHNTACTCHYIHPFNHTVDVCDLQDDYVQYDMPQKRFYKLIPFNPRNN